jgi:hypothetical protein
MPIVIPAACLYTSECSDRSIDAVSTDEEASSYCMIRGERDMWIRREVEGRVF